MVQELELHVPALRVVTPYRLATPLNSLPLFQVSVIEVVISESGATISKRAFLQRHAFVAHTVRALVRVYKERKGIWIRLWNRDPYRGLLLDWRKSRSGLALCTATIARSSLAHLATLFLAAQGHRSICYLDSQLEELVIGQISLLVAEQPSQLSALRDL